jgi:hypothetical protein
MSVIMHCLTYLALSWQTRPPSGRSEWPVTRTAAITTLAVAPVTPPSRTPLLDPRGLNPQLPPAVRSTEFLNRLNRMFVSYTSVSSGNSLEWTYCPLVLTAKPRRHRQEWSHQKPNEKYNKRRILCATQSATGLWHGKLVALSLGLCLGNGFSVFAEGLDVIIFKLSAINGIISFRSGWGCFGCVNARGLNS